MAIFGPFGYFSLAETKANAKFKYYCCRSSLIKLVRNSGGPGLFTIRGDGCSFPESNKI
jgi:hypothetical protein